jgi:hypothetical protein
MAFGLPTAVAVCGLGQVNVDAHNLIRRDAA